MKILVITGPPYSGKGTQCKILDKTLNYKHISTGDLIREEKEKNTPLGAIMKTFEEQGNLVPDDIMEQFILQILTQNQQEKGIILDGYPRTIPQVDTLIKLVEQQQKQIHQVLNIEVAKEELLKRAKARAENSDREDDKNEETHLKRITIFEEKTRPAIQHFKSLVEVVDIDGMGSIEEVTEEIERKLK